MIGLMKVTSCLRKSRIKSRKGVFVTKLMGTGTGTSIRNTGRVHWIEDEK